MLVIIFWVIFIARLFYLQISQHSYYEAEALKEHVSKFTIRAERGLIYAHDGPSKYAALVLNEPVYTVYADPRYVEDSAKVADSLRRIAGGNTIDQFESGLQDKTRQYAVLARGLNKTQAELLKKEDLRGVGLQQGDKRVYLEGRLAAQVLGFVNGEGQGQYGIEQGMNQELSGSDGLLKAVTDVHGIPISVGQENIQTPPKNGKNLVLTIDRTIQHTAERMLLDGLHRAGATKGSVLVLDPNSGAVLAMANWPSYQPAAFQKVTDYQVFQNRAVSDPYEPGSVIKALTMGVGLNERVIEPGSTYNNTGSVKVADAVIKNVLQYPRGAITMTQVLQYSFNTGAVHVLQALGGGAITSSAKHKLYDYFTQHYFFGKPTGVELANEVPGVVTSPDDPNGGPVTYANMTFGQGVTMSMLQVLSAFAADVNGGTYYTPQVVDGYLGDNNQFVDKSPVIRKGDVISPAASAKLRQMLHIARTLGPVGHGDKPGYMIGGKTGTAQVYDPKIGNYSPTATIGSYLGYGGRDKPRYVIMVRVDDSTIGGYSGSAAAAPIFTQLSNWLINYLQIQPRG